ncbi:MAG TPA: hypothetical protein VKV37_07460 [Ktedonobacteraceae bacterium]|jgi:hypothetical protein|nr:hypothetical protein [Ktedonobacteraceae bacterium]
MQRWSDVDENYVLYDDDRTDPALRGVTAPIAGTLVLREPWMRRGLRAIGRFFAAIIRKINQILGLALTVLELLFIARFLLIFFDLTASLFAHWIFTISAPLILPFNDLSPILPYQGFNVDVSTLVAMVVYAIAVIIVRRFLGLLARPW